MVSTSCQIRIIPDESVKVSYSQLYILDDPLFKEYYNIKSSVEGKFIALAELTIILKSFLSINKGHKL